MKMLVVPLVFCSLVCGSMAIGDTKKLGSVGVRTIVFYLFTTALAITVALLIGNLINPGLGLDMSAVQSTAANVGTTESTTLVETLLNIIPDNPISALSNGNMLQIIVFALLVGVILAKLGERAEVVGNFFSQFNDIMMEMTMMIMAIAPLGVFCLIARTFAGIGFGAFLPLGKYMIAVLIALAVQCLFVYLGLLKLFTGLNPIKFIKNFFPVMAFAFSTATSNATIPLSIDIYNSFRGYDQYGWYGNHAGSGSRLCGTSLWNQSRSNRLHNRNWNSYISFNWDSGNSKCWISYFNDGI